jgi:pimeloyl-ACP methyl ester carboxylesterase
VVRRPKLPAPVATAALLLSLAAAGCAGGNIDRSGAQPATAAPFPPGFSANTATRAGLVSGATATEAGCRALPGGLWVHAGRRHECLHYSAAGMNRPARTALVYIPGDPVGATYRFAAGRAQVENVSEYYELTDESGRASAETRSGALGGMPVVVLGRPGMHGSSGDHARDRHTPAEVELVDAALTELRHRYGLQNLVLLGFSSGGVIVADLLARRSDIRCAVIGSAPLDLAQYYRRPDGSLPNYFAMRADDLVDPMRSVRAIRSNAEIFVIGDRRDRIVPATAWEAWVAAARRRDLHVYAAEITGQDRPELGGSVGSRHLPVSRSIEVAQACATGMPADRVLRALQSQEPLLVPHGRRLGGNAIRAAFAGRRMRALEWQPTVNVLSLWGADGTLTYLDVDRGGQPITELRWRVEGDRLCTTRQGCGEVLADGRFLHLVTGEPPHLLMTVIAAPPEDERVQAAGARRGGG